MNNSWFAHCSESRDLNQSNLENDAIKEGNSLKSVSSDFISALLRKFQNSMSWPNGFKIQKGPNFDL